MTTPTERAAARAVVAASWVMTAPLAAFAALRLLRLDDRSGVLFAAQTLTAVAYLPAYASAVIAFLTRRVALAVLATAVAGLHLSWVWADLPRPRSRARVATEGDIVIAAVNVRATNSRPQELADKLAQLDADVLVVVELTPEILALLRRAGALDRYDHQLADPRVNFSGAAIFSRYPLTERSRLTIGHRTVSAVADIDGRAVRLVAVHTVQPLADLAALKKGLRRLSAIALDSEEPVIFAGDFNATRQHRPFRDLLAHTELVDAHGAAGRGYARTWPAFGPVPPFALLDHVVVSDSVAVVDAAEVDLPGSDHRGVVARLRLPPALDGGL